MHFNCAKDPSSVEGTLFRGEGFPRITVVACTNMSVPQTPGVQANALILLFLALRRLSRADVKIRFPNLD